MTETRATYREVLAEPVFRTLFLTRSLAISADTLRMFALSVLVFDRTGSPLLTAITFGIGFVPQVVGGTLFGALADRLTPRPLIVSGYLLEAVVAGALALLLLPIGVSLAMVAVIATLMPVFGGASNRLIAEALTGDAYVLGRSLSSVASGGAQLVGLAVGGAAVGALGPQRALLVTAGCHLVAATWVRLRLPAFPRPAAVAGSAVRQSWRVTGTLLGDRDVRALLLVQWLPPMFITGAEALVVPYMAERGFRPSLTGLVLACAPIGMVLGSVVMGRLVRPSIRERSVAVVIVACGLPLAALAVPLPLPVICLVLLLAGAGFCYSLGIQRAFLVAVPADLRGQGFALVSTGLMTLQGVGPVLTGGVAQFFSIGSAMAFAGAGAVAVGLWWWLGPARSVRPVVSPSVAGLG
jgi:predicted MFS family arabinose efflux permease